DDDNVVEFRVLGIGRGAEIGAAVVVELDDVIYSPIHDTYGHVIALIDAEGNTAERYKYTAYGEEKVFDANGTKIESSSLANPWRFCSKRIDDELGLVFFGKRYYCPETGRWTTPDPQGFGDGPNLYAYVHNNPLAFFDLYGYESEYERNPNDWDIRGNDFSCNDLMNYEYTYLSGDMFWDLYELLGWEKLFKRGLSFLGNTRFQGGCDILAGGIEIVAGIGVGAVSAGTVVGAVAGVGIAAHGLDRAYTGMKQIYTGSQTETGTSMALQSCGVPGDWAHATDDAFNIVGTLGAGAFIKSHMVTNAYKLENFAFKSAMNLAAEDFGISMQRAKPNRCFLKADSLATEAHSVFQRDLVTGKITKYATFRPQTNPKNLNPWEMTKRFDRIGKGHFNKAIKKDVYNPHVHDIKTLGGVRYPEPWEVP
ncbi:MAG: hypothetical protein HN831_04765, partial [Waddliaceae bacterium]|nr:hypothetical protein [Waddliaceae bacterium]